MLGRLAVCTALVCVLSAAPASAKIYCVKVDKCPKRGTETSLKAALKAASRSDKADRVKVGPGTFPGGVTMESGDTLRGGGRNRTIFVGNVGVRGPGSRVIALTVRMKPQDEVGMRADAGEVKRVRVDGTQVETDAVGVTLANGGTARNAQITLARGTAVSEGEFGGNAEDVRIDAPVGVHADYYGIDVRRAVITATTGIRAEDNTMSLDAVAIRLRGENPVGISLGSKGLSLSPVSAQHVTIVGEGEGTGIFATGQCSIEGVDATFDQIVIDSVKTHVHRTSSCNNEDGAGVNITITRSSYDKNRVESDAPGTLNAEEPVTSNPKLGPDMRPTEGSPLIDAGATDEAPGRDAAGWPRPVGAAADIGGFEFQG